MKEGESEGAGPKNLPQKALEGVRGLRGARIRVRSLREGALTWCVYRDLGVFRQKKVTPTNLTVTSVNPETQNRHCGKNFVGAHPEFIEGPAQHKLRSCRCRQ